MNQYGKDFNKKLNPFNYLTLIIFFFVWPWKKTISAHEWAQCQLTSHFELQSTSEIRQGQNSYRSAMNSVRHWQLPGGPSPQISSPDRKCCALCGSRCPETFNIRYINVYCYVSKHIRGF